MEDCHHSEVSWDLPVPQEVFETVFRSLKSREEFRFTGHCINCDNRVAISCYLGAPVIIPE
jgi:hypothetical protein